MQCRILHRRLFKGQQTQSEISFDLSAFVQNQKNAVFQRELKRIRQTGDETKIGAALQQRLDLFTPIQNTASMSRVMRGRPR